MSKKHTKLAVGLFVIVAIVIVAFFVVDELVDSFDEEYEFSSIENEWTNYTFGNYGLTIESPNTLEKNELPLPENVRNMIEEIDFNIYSNSSGFAITAISTKYSPEIGEAKLEGAAIGAVNKMMEQEGVSEFEYDEKSVLISGIEGIQQTGTYHQLDTYFKFINTILIRELNAWQVTVIFINDDADAEDMARRIVKSIEIKE